MNGDIVTKDWLCRPTTNAAAPTSAMQANSVRQDGEADGDGEADEDIDADESDIWTVLRVVLYVRVSPRFALSISFSIFP